MWPFSKSDDGESEDFYKPRKRLLYAYWNGSKKITADPLALYRNLLKYGVEIDIATRVARSPSKDADVKQQELIGYVRTIFEIAAFPEGGLTEIELLNLLDHFLTYIHQLKKNLNESATIAPPIQESSLSTSEASPLINSIADSGSTDAEPSTNGNPQSPKVSVSLSEVSFPTESISTP